MAVQEQTPYVEYVANGITTSFALGFDCDNRDHLIVLVDDVEPVAGAWSFSNGAVVFNAAPENGKKITIQRNTPFSRSTDYQSYNNSFRPPAVNNDFDRVWYKIQELGVKDWLLDLKIQKFRDDVNLTALKNTLEEAKQIRDDTADSVVEVQSNVAQSQTLLGNTTAQANLAQGYASSANSANAAAQQAAIDVSTAKADVYSDLSAQQIAVNNSLTAIAGGHKAYQTLAAAQAAQATLPVNSIVEVTNDGANNGTYQWNGTTLTKSAYDPLTQAKAYADLSKIDKNNVWYGYSNGNMVGPKTKQYIGKGIAGNWTIETRAEYNSKVIRADIAKELYILNSVQDYSHVNGYGVAFFDANPMEGAANRITDARTTHVDTVSGLTYLKVTVPDGAKYLAFNTKFNAIDINWAIHADGFSNNYNAGTEYIAGVLDSPVISKKSVQIESEISSGTTVIGDIYDSSKLLLNKYLNTQGTLAASSSAQAWKVFSFAVDEDVTYFVKITSALTYPFKAVYSKSLTDVSKTAGTFVSNVTLKLTEIENVYKFTVPNGLDIKAVFMNVELVTGTTPTIDLRDTLSIQKHSFDVAKIGVRKTAIDRLLGNALVDDEARKLASQAIQLQSGGSRLKGAKVLALGDSITQGTYGGYVEYLEAAFDTTVMNRGSSGGRASRVVDIVTAGEGLPKRDSSTAGVVWSPIDYTDLKCVTLMIGTNDSNNATFGDIADLPTSSVQDYATLADYAALFPNNYVSNIALAIEYIKWKAPDAEIHLITPPYLYNTTAGGTTLITKLIPHLEAVAKHYAAHLIYATYESGLSFKLMRGDLNIYSYDGTHFNKRGNEVFGKFVAQKVLNFG